ncbi:Rqc2 family fibronectin-binding protein [Desulfurobacterium sp.]
MDALYIEKVAEELNALFRKKKITGYEWKDNRFSISIDGRTISFVLKNQPGILIENKKLEDKTLLKKYRGLFIKEIKPIDGDRIIIFSLAKITLSGKIENYLLIIELTGKNSNVFFTDESRKIIFRAKEALTTAREIEPGKIYQPPPLDKKSFAELKFGKITPEGIEKNLYKHVAGLSPLNCKEIAFYVKMGMSLEEAYATFMEKHRQSRTAFVYFKNEKPKLITTFSYASLKGLKHLTFNGKDAFLQAWNMLTRETLLADTMEKNRKKLLKTLEKKLESIRNRLKNLEKPEELLKKAEELQKQGELLKYNLHLIRPGTDRISLTDFENNTKVIVKIDPSKTPSENLAFLFKKARKLKSRAKHEKLTAEQLSKEAAWIEAIKEKIKTADNREMLEELQALIAPEKKKKHIKKVKPFREIKLPSGKILLIGKSSIENEILSLKVAKPWDLWFHTREIPGSHVILRLEKNEKPSREDIETAASAAVFYSKGKTSGKVKVDFTRAENLKKPPGTPSGYITYKNEKTILTTAEKFEKIIKQKLSRA